MMTYSQTLEYLFTAMPSFQNIGAGAYKPGLERITQFCTRLGSPHLKYKVIHIAGTNGKGSVSHILASVLQRSGLRVALFTSPHLRDFRERIKVDGEMISEGEVIDFVERYRADMEELQLSFFEMTAAMAFNHFAHEGVDVAVIETGLGGRLDATNIVSPILSVITNIGIDHTKFLGTTLSEIAAEKAGIIKRGIATVLGEKGDEYSEVISSFANDCDSRLIYAEDRYSVLKRLTTPRGQRLTINTASGYDMDLEMDLGGVYQIKNIVTVLAALEYLRDAHILDISDDQIKDGVSNVVATTNFIGRWQRLSDSPRVICDTGHNAHGLKYVMEQLRATPHEKLIMVLGFANDKKLDEILPLFHLPAYFIFTRPKVDRAFHCEEVERVARGLGYDCESVEDVQEAVARAKSLVNSDMDLIFVGGSNFVVAEVI